MNSIDSEAAAASAAPGPTSAGGKLKIAREAAGLSVDAVAQQLKLAPRQVKALEEDDWARLPGRTFVRGFARNYARFVRLDPDAVLALLPASDAAPSLERPTLAASRRPMGEIPVERVARPSALRWLVPLLVLAIVAAAVFYEFSRMEWRLPYLSSNDEQAPAKSTAVALATPPAAAPGAVTTALPNPVSEATPGAATSAAAPSSAPTASAAAPSSASAASAAATGEPKAGAPGASSVAPAAAAGAASQSTALAGAASAAPSAAGALVLMFKGTSWVEVKDAHGRIVVQMTGGAGMTQTVSAVPPLELALGNAPQVDVTFRGQPLDLAPYTRGSVARVALK